MTQVRPSFGLTWVTALGSRKGVDGMSGGGGPEPSSAQVSVQKTDANLGHQAGANLKVYSVLREMPIGW